MTDRQIIIFDIDGTAIDSPKQKLPTNRLISAISKLKRFHLLCAATGRCWTFAKPVIQSLRLDSLCIISGGTQIIDPTTGDIVWQINIEPKPLYQVIEVFKTNPTNKLIFNDYTEEDYFKGGVHPKDFGFNQQINWLSQCFVPETKAKKLHIILNQIESITCVMVVSQKPGCRDLHIVNHEATKEHAIAELLKRLDVKKQNTIGIGDGHNDIHLFNAVGTKVAMGNAVRELQNLADIVIDPVDKDGLSSFFEKILDQ